MNHNEHKVLSRLQFFSKQVIFKSICAYFPYISYCKTQSSIKQSVKWMCRVCLMHGFYNDHSIYVYESKAKIEYHLNVKYVILSG